MAQEVTVGIIAYASELVAGKVLVAESYGGAYGETIRSTDLAELLRFLLEDYNEPERQLRFLKCAWDLDAFCSLIFRLLPITACRDLAGPRHQSWIRPFKLYYIKGKLFGIRYGQAEALIYGIKQYFADTDEPQTVVDVAKYGDRLLDAFARLGLTPTKLTSPVAIFEDTILRRMWMPSVYNMPDFEGRQEAMEYAVNCMDREWRSAFQVGQWTER